MARSFLDHSADANIQRNDLWSSLHLASANGHLKIAELLVQRGASVDIFNDKQETPLCQAVTNGQVEIARILIDHVVKLLLGRGSDADVLNNADKNAAELATEAGQARIAKFISEYKTDANIRNKLRSTTFDTTQYGVDDDGNEEEEGLLHTAVEEENIDVVKSLLGRGANVNAELEGMIPLLMAAINGNASIARLLIEQGADVDACDTTRSWAPLHFTSRYGHLEVSRVLIDHGANVNARQRNHQTPLDLSAGNGNLETAKLLLKRGADVHAVNSMGETPYQVSLQTGYWEIADLLREHGACSVRFDEILLAQRLCLMTPRFFALR